MNDDVCVCVCVCVCVLCHDMMISGPIETDMLLTRSSEAVGVLEFFKNLSPQKRIGTVADFGDAVALFASESARWISGQSILVSGAGFV
jgi:NAD(P)-dependent dehydrogenase (short-subunit alcohol dehydrogenase family)